MSVGKVRPEQTNAATCFAAITLGTQDGTRAPFVRAKVRFDNEGPRGEPPDRSPGSLARFAMGAGRLRPPAYRTCGRWTGSLPDNPRNMLLSRLHTPPATARGSITAGYMSSVRTERRSG